MKHRDVSGPGAPDCPVSGADRTEEFVRFLGKYQQRVYSFILTLVPHWADADEILQETSTVLWRKFADFKPGSDFVHWANQVAYYEVLKFRRRQRRDALRFSDAFVEEVAAEAVNMTDVLQIQRDCLASCVKKLPDKDRTLIQMRYQEDASTKRVAEQLNRSVDSVYKSLSRVRRALLICVHRMMHAEERA